MVIDEIRPYPIPDSRPDKAKSCQEYRKQTCNNWHDLWHDLIRTYDAFVSPNPIGVPANEKLWGNDAKRNFNYLVQNISLYLNQTKLRASKIPGQKSDGLPLFLLFYDS